ncbi:MAG: hypothetical protein AB9866_01665 [Syntrophobacteraceae bacterium]
MNSKPQLFQAILWIFWALFLLFPGEAAATQVHPPEEGVYVHQLGHVFFILSMGILIYWLRLRKLTKVAGWRFIQYAALFAILWNIDAIAVHYIEDMDDIFEFVGVGELNRWIHVVGGHDYLSLIYYFGRMDHLLCVPMIFFLYLGLKHLLKETAAGGVSGEQP